MSKLGGQIHLGAVKRDGKFVVTNPNTPEPEGAGNVTPSEKRVHASDCEWHLDQYPWECTCGAEEFWK